MHFLHEGLPELVISRQVDRARVPRSRHRPIWGTTPRRTCSTAASWNICSKEPWVRQYDHEVQGRSVVKPFTGAKNDGPSDAAVLQPVPNSVKGLVWRTASRRATPTSTPKP
jgi:phosphoribosylformylglycinamidine (FGAM) synthase-like enzyme